jgi:hypothetical protein
LNGLQRSTDFADQQIGETFVENWFLDRRNDLPKAKRFMARLEENESIQISGESVSSIIHL